MHRRCPVGQVLAPPFPVGLAPEKEKPQIVPTHRPSRSPFGGPVRPKQRGPLPPIGVHRRHRWIIAQTTIANRKSAMAGWPTLQRRRSRIAVWYVSGTEPRAPARGLGRRCLASSSRRGLCALRGGTSQCHRVALNIKKLPKRTQITPVLQQDQCRFQVGRAGKLPSPRSRRSPQLAGWRGRSGRPWARGQNALGVGESRAPTRSAIGPSASGRKKLVGGVGVW
jgi:hypothetical protein